MFVSQYCVIPRKGGLLLGVVKKVETYSCVVSSQEPDASLLGNLKEGQSKASPAFRCSLQAEVLSGFCLCLKPGVTNNRYQSPNR